MPVSLNKRVGLGHRSTDPVIWGAEGTEGGGEEPETPVRDLWTPGNQGNTFALVQPDDQDAAGLTSYESFIGRQVKFYVIYTAGNWANSSPLQPKNWSTADGGFNNHIKNGFLGQGNGIWSTHTDLTLIVTDALCHGAQNLAMVDDPDSGTNPNYSHWYNRGVRIAQQHLDVLHADGRPYVIMRIGHELDGSWYPWGTTATQTGRNTRGHATESVSYRIAHELAITWMKQGIEDTGGNPDNVLFDVNYNTSPRSGTNNANALPGNCDIVTQDTYDIHDDYNGLSQSAKDSVELQVWNKKVDANSGLNWGINLARANGKRYGIDEAGIWYGWPDGGGDHPNFLQRFYDWMVAPAGGGRSAGPLTDNLMYHWAYFEGSNGGGSAKLVGSNGDNNAPNSKAKLLALF